MGVTKWKGKAPVQTQLETYSNGNRGQEIIIFEICCLEGSCLFNYPVLRHQQDGRPMRMHLNKKTIASYWDVVGPLKVLPGS